jgi:hypothetical protein
MSNIIQTDTGESKILHYERPEFCNTETFEQLKDANPADLDMPWNRELKMNNAYNELLYKFQEAIRVEQNKYPLSSREKLLIDTINELLKLNIKYVQ